MGQGFKKERTLVEQNLEAKVEVTRAQLFRKTIGT
jgi:hypothetical protein